MTDREMAEEWADKNITLAISWYNPQAKSIAKRAFLAGLKSGKDMNVATKWHKVADGDLPNIEFGRADVTVAYLNAYENPCKMDCCFDGTNFIYWDDRKPVGWKKADIFGKIYAWKYQEKLPELPKEVNGNDN